jgi:type IV secretion system protein VirB6
MNWTLFATIIAQIDAPVASAVNAMFGALISYVEPAFRAALIGYVTFRLLQEAIAPRAEPWNVAVMTLMKGAAVYSFLLGAGAYGHYVQALFMDGLPNEITRVVSSAVGNAPITSNAFDQVWGGAWAAGLAVYKELPRFAIALQMVVVLYWAAALIGTAIGCLVWEIPRILLAVLVGTGPLFGILLVFRPLTGIASRWLAGMLACVILQVFVVALLTLIISAENTLLSQIASSVAGSSGGWNAANEMDQLKMLAGGALLFGMLGYIAKQLPSAAQTIAGGLHLYTDMAMHAGLNAVGRAGQTIAATGRAMLGSSPTSAGSSGGSVRQVATTVATRVPGASLSVRRP